MIHKKKEIVLIWALQAYKLSSTDYSNKFTLNKKWLYQVWLEFSGEMNKDKNVKCQALRVMSNQEYQETFEI